MSVGNRSIGQEEDGRKRKKKKEELGLKTGGQMVRENLPSVGFDESRKKTSLQSVLIMLS